MLFYLIIRFDTIFIAHIILLSLYTPSTTRPNVPLPSSFRITKLYILKLTLRGKGVWSMLLLWLLLRIKDGGVFLICQFSDCFRRVCVLGRLVMFSDISSALGVSEELVAIDSWKLLFYCQAVLFFFITRAYTALSLLPEFFLSYFEKPNNSVLKLNFLFCKKLAERLVYSLELPS